MYFIIFIIVLYHHISYLIARNQNTAYTKKIYDGRSRTRTGISRRRIWRPCIRPRAPQFSWQFPATYYMTRPTSHCVAHTSLALRGSHIAGMQPIDTRQPMSPRNKQHTICGMIPDTTPQRLPRKTFLGCRVDLPASHKKVAEKGHQKSRTWPKVILAACRSKKFLTSNYRTCTSIVVSFTNRRDLRQDLGNFQSGHSGY